MHSFRSSLTRLILIALAALVSCTLVITGSPFMSMTASAAESATQTIPKGPTFNDAAGTVYIPADAGVRYYIYVGDETDPRTKEGLPYSKPGLYTDVEGIRTDAVVRIEARSAGSPTALSGTVEWAHLFPSEATAPVFDDEHTTVTLPTVEGATFTVDGVDQSGTVSATQGATATVVARATSATEPNLEAGSWQHAFPFARVPVAAIFDAAQQTVQIPYGQAGIRYRLTVGDDETVLSTDPSLGYTKPARYGVAEGIQTGVVIHVTTAPASSRDMLFGDREWYGFFFTPEQAPTFDDGARQTVIPDVPGVQFAINGVDVAPGPQAAGSATDVTITARLAEVASAPTVGSWAHTFAPAPDPIEALTPTFRDDVSTLVIPAQQGVRYSITQGDDATPITKDGLTYAKPGTYSKADGLLPDQEIHVAARPVDSSTVLSGTTEWTHTFTASVPKGAAFRDDNSTVTIPSDPGIRYFITQGPNATPITKDGLAYAKPGIYSKADGLVPDEEVRVVAAPASSTTMIVGTQEWKHTFTALVPVGATFRDDNSTVYIPSDAGIRYYIYVGDSTEPVVKDGLPYSRPGTYGSTEGILEGEPIRVEARPASATRMVGGTTTWTHTFAKRPDYSLIGGDEFNDPSNLLAKGWEPYQTKRSSLGQFGNTVYLGSNVSVSDGNLRLTTKRHCLKPGEEASDSNVSVAPCPAGTKSVFSSGRVSTDFIYNSAENGTKGPFSMEVRARMSDGTVPGFHFAGWMRNNQPYCSPTLQSSDIAEIDTMEVFTSDKWKKTTNTTHIGCAGTTSSDTTRNHNELAADIAGQWHTYRMEWNGYSIRYFLDGAPVPLDWQGLTGYETTAATLGISDADFNRMMNDYPWELIFDSRAFEGNLSWMEGPNHQAPFAERTDVVDYVRIATMPDVAPYGAIGERWRQVGWLGSPTTAEADVPGVSGARFQQFQNGAVYWSADTGAVEVSGGIGATYVADTTLPSKIGLPTTGESRSADRHGAYQPFQRGSIHWSPSSGTHATRGAIEEYWAAHQWEFGFLGYPIDEELSVTGGASQQFQGGTVFWSASTGAHAVRAGVLKEYAALGWEQSDLGFPTTDEFGGLRDGGAFQSFAKGQIHWSPQLGAHATKGGINAFWGATGWENGYAGYPVDIELGVRGGASQSFQRATLFWESATGDTFGVRGAIRTKYSAMGWEQGSLGFPKSEERALANGASQSFASGQQVHWSPQTGAHVTGGAIQKAWADSGWETGWLGYPTGDEVGDPITPGGRMQTFSGGTIHWSMNGLWIS